MIGAMLVMNGTWRKPGVYNMEEFDPDPFMDALNKWGLPGRSARIRIWWTKEERTWEEKN